MIGASVLLRRHLGEATVGRTRYAPRAVCARHAHSNARLVLVLRGRFEEQDGARTRHAMPYLALYRPAGEPHGERFGPDGAICISIDLPAAWLERHGAAAPVRAGQWRDVELAARMEELDGELAAWDAGSAIAAEGLILEILDGTMRPRGTAAPAWWRRAEDRLLDGFRDSLTLVELAAAAGIHPVHLARTVRARTGQTVGARLRELRVRWACAELRRSDAPIAEIAAAAGFSDESHMCRTIKRLTGQTPGQIRVAR